MWWLVGVLLNPEIFGIGSQIKYYSREITYPKNTPSINNLLRLPDAKSLIKKAKATEMCDCKTWPDIYFVFRRFSDDGDGIENDHILCYFLIWLNSIPPERFSQGSDLIAFPKIIPEIRVRFFWGKPALRKIKWEVLLDWRKGRRWNSVL